MRYGYETALTAVRAWPAASAGKAALTYTGGMIACVALTVLGIDQAARFAALELAPALVPAVSSAKPAPRDIKMSRASNAAIIAAMEARREQAPVTSNHDRAEPAAGASRHKKVLVKLARRT